MALQVSEHIFKRLRASSELTAICGQRIYPIVAQDGVESFPCVTVEVTTSGTEYSKCGPMTDQHNAMIVCMGIDYANQVLPMANAVRKALECVTDNYDDYIVTSCTLASCTSDYHDELGAYAMILQFDLESTC